MVVYPALFVGLGIVVYAIAYFVYGKWYDKTAWQPDPKRPTPAHVYMDGIEFFPANKYVLYGFQFKGIAGLGPILGPFVALVYGWVPALIWILLGNFFIGWIHDYSAIMLTVRNEGKTMGPLTYEYISPRARNALLGFLLFYLILITAVFVLLCGLFFTIYPASVLGTFFVVLAGVISGALVYKARMSLIYATIIGLVIMAVGIALGIYFPVEYNNMMFWMFITCVYCFIGAVTPMLWYTQPVVFMASFPCIFGILLIIIAALASPATGVTIQQPAFITLYNPNVGPIWPILTVSIACGAISGWHSLVGTSGSGRQLDVETDALPVGAGAMLTEGLLALASLAAYMVLTGAATDILKLAKWAALVEGTTVMVPPILGGSAAVPFVQAFFAIWLELFAITIQMLVTRFFRLALAEVVAPVPSLRVIIGNKYVASAIGLAIGFAFAYTGAWINLWLLFGGSNQLLAGLALLLATMYLAREKRIKGPTLGPGIFMVVTCEAALLWEAYVFFKAVVLGKPIAKGTLANYPTIALGFNAIFGIIGIVLFILGLIVIFDWYKSYKAAK